MLVKGTQQSDVEDLWCFFPLSTQPCPDWKLQHLNTGFLGYFLPLGAANFLFFNFFRVPFLSCELLAKTDKNKTRKK